MRKVVQIAVAVHEGRGKHTYPDMIYALCEDGSIWYCSCVFGNEDWTRVNGIPDPEEKKGKAK